MQEIVRTLMSQVDLSEDQSKQAIDVIAGFLKQRLPEQAHGMLDLALNNEQVKAGMADMAKGALSSFFGRKNPQQ